MIETFIVVLLIVILVLVIQFKGDINKQLLLLQLKIDQLQQQQRRAAAEDTREPGPDLSAPLPQPKPVAKPSWQRPPPAPTPAPVYAPAPDPLAQPVAQEPAAAELPVTPTPIPNVAAASAMPTAVPAAAVATGAVVPPTAPPRPAKPPRPSFRERNPDLEKFIGENLFNKIGIAILVLGIGFFLKYAIDKDWINEIGRTFIGIISGGLLIGLAHRMRKTFAAFSSVLVGGGLATLYFTTTIAFQEYHLLSQTLAFALTILITGFAVLLALSYDRRELAVLAILGGFSAPFLVSTGEGNAVVLFTYILVLNVGMLVLAYYKKWNIINIISYLATVLLFGGWLVYNISSATSQQVPPYFIALVYATLFYLVFFLMNIINNVRNQQRFGAFDICILLSNTFLYYSAGMVILYYMHATAWQGLFTALLAVFNCVFAFLLFRREKADRTLIFLLIGLVLTFISLAAPVQLEGNYITLFWAAETVLLFWLSQRSGIALMRYASILVMVLMFFSLMMDWQQLYFDSSRLLTPFVNKIFITSTVCVIALFLLRRLLTQEPADKAVLPNLLPATYKRVLLVFAIGVIYVGMQSELWFQCRTRIPLVSPIITGSFNYLSTAVLLYLSRRAGRLARFGMLILAVIAALAFPLYYNTAVTDLRMEAQYAHGSIFYFHLHYLLIALLSVMLYQAHKTLLSLGDDKLLLISQWFIAAVVLYMLSAELDHLVLLFIPHLEKDMDQLLDNVHRTGYAILWGAFAFVLMFLGLRWKSTTVRIISIGVFALTLLKLFLFDFRALSEGGKIAAFISLGILLLIISFMYQRLKKMILTDENKTASTTTTDETI